MRKLQILICGFVFSLSVFAQTDRGTITGTVSDETGAVIPGAAVEAKNVATGTLYPAGSSETSDYTLAQLPAGTYEHSVNLPGFRKFVRPGVIVEVARIVRIDATLQVGAATDAVTVEAASPLLKTESGEISQNRVPGVSLFSKDPNSHSIDPTTDLVLNPAAWTDAPPGQFGTSAPYYTTIDGSADRRNR